MKIANNWGCLLSNRAIFSRIGVQDGSRLKLTKPPTHSHFVDHDEVADWLSSRVLHLDRCTSSIFFLQFLYDNSWTFSFMMSRILLTTITLPPWSEDHYKWQCGAGRFILLYLFQWWGARLFPSVVLSSDVTLSWSRSRTLLALPDEMVVSSCIYPSYSIGVSSSKVIISLLVVSAPRTGQNIFYMAWYFHQQGLNKGYKLSSLSPSRTVLYTAHAVSSPKQHLR